MKAQKKKKKRKEKTKRKRNEREETKVIGIERGKERNQRVINFVN